MGDRGPSQALQGIDLLGHAHTAKLGGVAGSDAAGQDQAGKDGAQLQDHRFRDDAARDVER
jgi:hypothetical protein